MQLNATAHVGVDAEVQVLNQDLTVVRVSQFLLYKVEVLQNRQAVWAARQMNFRGRKRHDFLPMRACTCRC